MNKYIAIYLRLSQDDATACESNSITNQRQVIESYISADSELSELPVMELSDDGYSGTSFERPGVKLLLEAVRKGEVCCIIVKDFSRFGRQYLEVSRFIEQIFPCMGVRFIAINDHYDSDRHKGTTADIGVPVRNLINAMYSRDISGKVKSAKRTQARNGVFSNAFAPYGYIKDVKDHHRILIDEPAAIIVRRIFTLSEQGHSAFKIADMLNKEGVLSPAMYKKQNGSKLPVGDTARTFWTKGIVSRLLRDERYTGTLVSCQRERIRVGSGKRRHTPKDTWVRVPGAIPAIIPSELFNNFAAKRHKFTSHAKPNTDRMLYKKVRCGHCGHVLTYIGDAAKPYYMCDTARYTDRHGCMNEKIREQRIIDSVKAAAHVHIASMLDVETLCRDNKSVSVKGLEAAAMLENDINHLKARKRQLYESYKNGCITQAAFISEREAVDLGIVKKTAERDTLLAGKERGTGEINSTRLLFSSFANCRAIAEPGGAMANELVEAVYVFGTDRIEVRFSFADELQKSMEG